MRTRTFVLAAAALALLAAGCSQSTDPSGSGKRLDIQAIGVGDRVWDDANGDGVQDMGEPGLPGVEVRLLDCAGVPIDTMLTAADGTYGFGLLAAGDYMLWFDLPSGYAFSPQYAGTDTTVDSDVDPATGLTACISLAEDEINTDIDAGMVAATTDTSGCTYGKGYWKNHSGCRAGREDLVTELLPLSLGDEGGAKTLEIAAACDAYIVLRGETCWSDDDDDKSGNGDHGRGHGEERGKSNGIGKLSTALLVAKLNVANGADDADIAATVSEVDAFLADHDCTDWTGLGRDGQRMVQEWRASLDSYNDGRTGPGSCERGDGCDDDHDDDDDDDDDHGGGDDDHGGNHR